MRITGRPAMRGSIRAVASAPARVLIRAVAIIPVLASLTVVGVATGAGPSAAGCAQAASVHHAALVVEHGNGAGKTACVSFTTDSITGDELLALSGLEYATAAYSGTGKAVCQVDGEPAQYPPSCWTASSPYWAMYVGRGGGPWAFSSLGVSSQTFHDGDAEGFRYEGQSAGLTPPSAAGVCPVMPPSTPAPVSTPAPPTVAATRTAPSPSEQPLLTLGAIAAVSPSPSDVPPSAASVGTAAGVIATSRSNPPAPLPSSSPAGIWFASTLGGVLLVLLAVRLIRVRRRSPP